MLKGIAEVPRFSGNPFGWNPVPSMSLPSAIAIAILSFLPGIFVSILFYLTPAEKFLLTVELVPLLLGTILVIPLHELLHMLAAPKFGLTNRTQWGLEPQIGFFVVHLDPVSRGRWVVMMLTPFIFLTVLPLVATSFGYFSETLCVIATVNASLAILDLYSSLWLLRNIPRGSRLVADGRETLFLPPSS